MAHMVFPRQDEGKSGADTLVELLSKGFGSEVRRHGIALKIMRHIGTNKCHRSPTIPSMLRWEPHWA
jgi:hypothetical protein